MTLVAGCYERFLFEYAVPDLSDGPDPVLKRTFTYAAHKSAVRCAAACWPFMVSGGADDTIHLYDLQQHQDLGFLVNPGQGAIPCIQVFKPENESAARHMFTGSADGSISVWQFGESWVHLRVLKGHKTAVNDLSIHPSGKVALSVAHNMELRMWNLMKGRCTYTSKLDAEADFVNFSSSGSTFVLGCGTKLKVQGTELEGQLLHTLEFPRKVICCEEMKENVLCLGLEDGSLQIWDVRASKAQHIIDRAHKSRVKGLVRYTPLDSAYTSLFSVSTDGVIKQWDERKLGDTATCFAETATNARLTCVCITAPPKHQDQSKLPITSAAAQSKPTGKSKKKSQKSSPVHTEQHAKQPDKLTKPKQATGAAEGSESAKQHKREEQLKGEASPANGKKTKTFAKKQKNKKQQHHGEGGKSARPELSVKQLVMKKKQKPGRAAAGKGPRL